MRSRPHSISQVIGVAALGILLGSLASCSGRSLNKIEAGATIDLPSELGQKFEVKDEVKDVVETSYHPNPVSETKKKQKSVGGALALAPKHFEYPKRRPLKDPIWVSETLVYQISYFGISAGEFTVKVLPHKTVNHRKVYHVYGNAVSSKLFSLFYKLNDTVESFIDYEGIFSHRFHITLDETKQTRDSLELNDSEKKQTFYWNRWNHKTKGYIEIKDYFPIQPFSQDTLSSMYYLRTVDMPNGKVFTVPIVSEGKSWDAEVTVLRREKVDSPKGEVQAIVLKPETKYQGVLQKRGESYLWLSDDERKLLLRLEAKVKIGTLVAVLKKVDLGTPPEEKQPERLPTDRNLSSQVNGSGNHF